MTDVETDQHNPLAIFLADPHSHFSDILYLNFRLYKRQLIYRLFRHAVDTTPIAGNGALFIADIGASMGFDVKYVLNLETHGFRQRPTWGNTHVSFVEGADELIAAGQVEWSGLGADVGLTSTYLKADITRRLPVSDGSQHVVLCSEVVEHLVDPGHLFAEMFRILKPGGHLILTTDNSPSLLQRIRRVPRWLAGAYEAAYAPPLKENEVVGQVFDSSTPIYGHIGLHSTRYWEQLVGRAGFTITSFGTYESIRRGGGIKTPAALAAYFVGGFIVSLLPRRLGRYFGDTTAFAAMKAAA